MRLISYSGSYPNLCSGELIIEINEIEYNLGNCLTSNGSVSFDDNWNENVTEGSWSIEWSNVPYTFSEERKEAILDLVNSEVPHGCCGGCV